MRVCDICGAPAELPLAFPTKYGRRYACMDCQERIREAMKLMAQAMASLFLVIGGAFEEAGKGLAKHAKALKMLDVATEDAGRTPVGDSLWLQNGLEDAE